VEKHDFSDVDEDSGSEWEDAPKSAKKKGKTDPNSNPENVEVVRTGSGTEITTFETANGLSARSQRKDDVLETSVTGMKKQAHRARTQPATGHVTLHSEAKGPKGGRKYNPNDQASVHVGGPAIFGVPGTKNAKMTVDASPWYNKQHIKGHEAQLHAGDAPGLRWDADTRVVLEDPEAEERLDEGEGQAALRADRARVQKRMRAVKEANPDARAVQSMDTEYSSNAGATFVDRYGRDLRYYCKEKWFGDAYDPDDSSSDKDVRGEV
jgi:hypothetical protein